MRKLVIENLDLMCDEEEDRLIEAILNENVEFKTIGHGGAVTRHSPRKEEK